MYQSYIVMLTELSAAHERLLINHSRCRRALGTYCHDSRLRVINSYRDLGSLGR